LELIRDYDLEVHYHPGKANVVADALSRKAHCNCLSAVSFEESLCHAMAKLNLEIIPQGTLNHICIEPTLEDQIIRAQGEDEELKLTKTKIAWKDDGCKHFRQDEKGIIYYKNRLVVPNDPELKRQILTEAHMSKISVHPGSNKMYHDLR